MLGDIPKTVDSTVLAFADDPIVLYIREPARTGPVQRKVYRCMLYLEWLQFVAHKRAWTVNHGESIIIRQEFELLVSAVVHKAYMDSSFAADKERRTTQRASCRRSSNCSTHASLGSFVR